MSVYHRSTAKSRILQEYRNREEEIAAALSRQMNHKAGLESEKRMRREIANSNERRRMQSINAGFQHLRTLLPHTEGEKLSKAAILQQTTDFIRNMQQEKAKIHAQNAYYKRLLSEVSRRCNIDLEMDISLCGGSPPLKRKKRDTDFEECKYEDVRREVMELRQKLEQERQLRMVLELRAHTLESHHYAEKLQHANHVEQQVHLPSVPMEKPVSVTEEPKREEQGPALPLCADHENDHPSSSPTRPEPVDTPSSMSRRNLETIVEAIRHLEGESIKNDQQYSAPISLSQAEALHPKMYIHHSEESENSCDDLRSESSGRDSPSAHHHHNYVRLQSAQNLQHVSSPKLTSSSVVMTSSSYSDKYPAVTNVLQGNSAQLQMYYRPGVIVQNS
ncbi:transcription factor AP-4-like isoform X2 [Ruditapes philippinarum]|uniref:transcription factor AP-4-like isoform X2 n=1 Tax=Ruditapes philippinarum TaxID=129788 RepID=UPI00295C051B|nr:transcription factor AP-4-like isoform X2 [Ruditapes philippinarum]